MKWYLRSGMVLLTIISLAMLGCGSASNNDQGVSFTMLGYSVAASASTPTTGTTTAACSTSPNLSSGVFAIGSQSEESGSTPQVLAGVVVQNNLTTQFIRTQSLALEYIIPGSQTQPPSTVVPYGGVVAQAGGLQCGVVTLVPPQIISWMSLNRQSLPELPFFLIVRGQVTGTSTAGDVFTSNPVDIGYTVVTDVVIPPDDNSVDGDTAFEDDDSDSAISEGDEIIDDGDTPVVSPGDDSQI